MRFNWKRSSVVPFRLLAYHFFSFISSVLFFAIENEITQYILEGQSECLHRVSARCNDKIPFPSCSSTVLWSYLILPDPLRSYYNTIRPGLRGPLQLPRRAHCALNSACQEGPDRKIQEFSIILALSGLFENTHKKHPVSPSVSCVLCKVVVKKYEKIK